MTRPPQSRKTGQGAEGTQLVFAYPCAAAVCGAPISAPAEGPSPLEGVPLRNVDTGEVVPLALAPHEDFDTLEGFSRETYMMQHGPRAGAVDSSPGASSASPAGECTQGEAFVSPTSAVNMRGCGGV